MKIYLSVLILVVVEDGLVRIKQSNLVDHGDKS